MGTGYIIGPIAVGLIFGRIFGLGGGCLGCGLGGKSIYVPYIYQL